MSDFERTLKQHLVSYRKVRTVYARDLGGGRDDAVERLLPEARGRAERVADAHQDASERRRQVEVVDEEAVVLEAAERQPDRHERDGSRPLRAVDEAARRHHARRHDATCSRPARHRQRRCAADSADATPNLRLPSHRTAAAAASWPMLISHPLRDG